MKTSSREPITERRSSTARAALLCAIVALALVPGRAGAFNSGSTGADGALMPTVDTQVALPADGILNYTAINVPSGVTVTFTRNVTNTPVVLLVVGDVTIAGTIDLNGKSATNSGAAGDGNLGDDGQPGAGGPGGFDGGRGGPPGQSGGAGLGPGGGVVAPRLQCGSGVPSNGTGGGFGTSGEGLWCPYPSNAFVWPGGASYGASLLLPLIGGSGGGGGAGGDNFGGAGGGGGGGAILIAASGTVTVTGVVRATGGWGGGSWGAGAGGPGGSGSGGGIRIVASTIAGNGTIQAVGGGSPYSYGADGGVGRIRLEAEVMQRTDNTSPAFTTSAPGPVFVAGSPSLLITSVAGIAAPAAPTGNADIVLPADTPNPVTVGFTTHGVPVGNTVTLTVTPALGPTISVVSLALTGNTDTATASVNVNLPSGPSVLSATTSFTVTAALGDALSRFAQGERVEKVTLVARPGAPSMAVLHTRSGKTFEVASALLRAGR